MNRRSFLKGILALSVAPHFLPGAGRLWKATWQPNPAWEAAEVEAVFLYNPVAFAGAWSWTADSESGLSVPVVYNFQSVLNVQSKLDKRAAVR